MMEPFRLAVPMPVRFRDTDAMGHVNNAVYMSYLEVARTVYWTEVFGLDSYANVDFILARTEIDFVAPVFVEDEIEVLIRVNEIGNRSFRFAYEIRRQPGGECVVRAESVQVMYDYAAGKSKPLSDEQRAKMLEFEDAAAVVMRGAGR
jgi:acyl-CoA thioester hydrolase